MFYKLTLKNLMIDGLVIGLVAFSILKSKYAAPADIGLTEFYWMLLAAGVFLIRWAYLAWSYFYGENANKNPGLLFKIHKVWVTFGAVVSFVLYFIIIFIFLL
jgi:hypothetical protein